MHQCAGTEMGGNWSGQLVNPGALPYGDAVVAFCRSNRLTPREEQIAHMICSGMSNADMARDLGISNATVRLHIGNVHRKLGTRSKVDLVVRIWNWSMNGRAPAESPRPQPFASCPASA
jgi:DNA-binding CsgD family transcriptional regulator